MPRRSAVRITGSPIRCTTRAIMPARPPPASSSASTRPVSMNAQADAFTVRLSAWPRCACQSAVAMRSSISASAVAASGMRSSASARHNSATPSRVPRLYSRRKSVTSLPGRCAARAACTRVRARAATRAARSGGSVAACSSGASTSASGARWRARILDRSGSGAGMPQYGRRPGAGYGCSRPSTGMLRPLIQLERGEDRNTITSATSSPVPRRPIGKPLAT